MQHKVNYNDIKKKIQRCSNELNDALKLVNLISSPSEYITGEYIYTNMVGMKIKYVNDVMVNCITNIIVNT